MTRGSALVVDAESTVGERDFLSRAGIEISRAANGARALELARRHEFDVVLAGSPMPGVMGMVALRKLRKIDPDIAIIVLDDASSPQCVEEAFEEDIFDCLHRPVDVKVLLRTVQHAIERHRLILENHRLTQQLLSRRKGQRRPLSGGNGSGEALSRAARALVGESACIEEVRRQIAEVAPTDMTVLLDGETGTGKDVAAQLIHEMSSRAKRGTLIKINCPAVPGELLESELFGHEAGAFTGAGKRKPGRFELAGGGSVFLNEISQVPLMVQGKLLEVLEHKEFARLGGKETIHLDTRILAATNTSLEQMMESGRFRADLYFRLNQYIIHMPPLRERVEDIPLLVDHFLKKYGPIYRHEGLAVSSEMISFLVQYPWPGNVRELESAIRRYALTAREESIHTSLLQQPPSSAESPAGGTYRENEKKIIMAALAKARWNRRRAAEILGISYNTVRRRIAQYKLDGASDPAVWAQSAWLELPEDRRSQVPALR